VLIVVLIVLSTQTGTLPGFFACFFHVAEPWRLGAGDRMHRVASRARCPAVAYPAALRREQTAGRERFT
jgi:hypothetical protein